MNSHTSELKSPSHELTCTQLTGVSCPTQTTSDGTDLAAWWLSLLGSAAVESNTLMDSTRFTAACIDDGHDIDEPLQVHRKARSRKQRAAGIYLPMSASRLPASHLPKTLHAAIIFHGLLMSKDSLVKILVQGQKCTYRCRALPEPRRAVLLETPAIGVQGKEEKCWLAKAVVVFQPSYSQTSKSSSSCAEDPDSVWEHPHAWPISDVREVCPPVPIPRQFGPVTWIKISRAEVAAVARATKKPTTSANSNGAAKCI